MIDWHREYAQLRALWRKHPELYARQRLGLNPTWQQAHLLKAIAAANARVSVRSGHSTGKSTGMAAAIWWKLECFDFAKIPCTAPSAGQLRDILWAELAKWFRNSIAVSQAAGMPPEYWLSNLFEITQDKIFCKGAPKEWFAVARTSRPETPDAMQGFHASDIRISDDGMSIVEGHDSGRGEIMFVVDEAAGVQNIVYEVVEGALASPNASLLMGGNPTRSSGYFANSHKHNRGDFACLHFRSSDSPLVAEGYREGLVRKFGEGSNVVRVRADGEFPRADDDTLIPLDLVEAAISREPHPPEPGHQRRLGIDVARYGDDRTVFVLRAGPNIEHVRIEAKLDLMAIVGITVQLIKQWRAHAVFVDTIGVGGGVYDRLIELRKKTDDAGQPKIAPYIQITDVNVAQKAPVRAVQIFDVESQPYRLRDYLWLEMARWLRDDEPSFAGADADTAQDLAGELASVRFAIDSSGRTVIEAKDAMKKRGLRSCDLADALGATFYTTGIMGGGAALFEIVRRQAEALKAKAGAPV